MWLAFLSKANGSAFDVKPDHCRLGDWPNTVSGTGLPNAELSELLGPHRVSGKELRECLLGHYLCAEANPPSFSQNSVRLAQNSVSSLFWKQ